MSGLGRRQGLPSPLVLLPVVKKVLVAVEHLIQDHQNGEGITQVLKNGLKVNACGVKQKVSLFRIEGGELVNDVLDHIVDPHNIVGQILEKGQHPPNQLLNCLKEEKKKKIDGTKKMSGNPWSKGERGFQWRGRGLRTERKKKIDLDIALCELVLGDTLSVHYNGWVVDLLGFFLQHPHLTTERGEGHHDLIQNLKREKKKSEKDKRKKE